MTLAARLDTLLDAEAMAGPVAALFGGESRGLVRHNVWIKPGRHYQAAYTWDAGSLPVAGDSREMSPPGREPDAARGAGDGQPVASALVADAKLGRKVLSRARKSRHAFRSLGLPQPAALWRPEAGIALQRFPLDYRLPTMPLVLDPALVSAATGLELTSAELISYRPGIRAVLRYSGKSGGGLFGKVAAGERAVRSFGNARRFHESSVQAQAGFRFPRPVAVSAVLQLGVVEAVPGESVYDLIQTARAAPDVFRRVGVALASMHDGATAGLPSHDSSRELEVLDGWIELTMARFPQASQVLAEGRAMLGERGGSPSPGGACIHRDFYDKQILVDGEALFLIDPDTAAVGDAELDLGNFEAHLIARAIQRVAARSETFASPGTSRACETSESFDPVAVEATSFRDALLSGYSRRFSPDMVTWYRRASLLRLSCYYAARMRWAAFPQSLAQEALR